MRLATHSSRTKARASTAPLVQRKCSTCGSTKREDDRACPKCQGISRKATAAAGPTSSDAGAISARLGDGQPVPSGVRRSLETTFGHRFDRVRIHADAPGAAAASELGAHAFTIGEDIGFASGQYRPGTVAGDALLAHELAHVVQQSKNPQRVAAQTKGGDDGALETEADDAAAVAVAQLWGDRLGLDPAMKRQLPAPVFSPGGTARPALRRCGGAQRANEPPMTRSQMLVARARVLIPLIEEYIMRKRLLEFNASQILAAREGIEEPLAIATGRPQQEERRVRRINRRPLRIEVTEQEVVFHVRFHARYEDESQRSNFGALQSAVEAGARDTWTQDLTEAMPGKTFRVVPTVTLVDLDAPRDHDYWLIHVRATDQTVPTHPGCTLDNPLPVVAALAEPTCDGGVMHLPPSLVRADIIGHEMLHLFGLLDRYLMLTHQAPDGTTVTNTVAARSPGRGRLDPLGSEDGPVLEEDLGFLMHHLGVYGMELSRGLEVVAEMEARGVNLVVELQRQREILRTGRDPNSLLPIREDFHDRMLRDAERVF